MWYGSGTIAVTANGNNATGTGTQFLGNVRVGDGIAIQGSATLHEVTGVTSNTQLTFAPPYAGTAGSGKAFRVVPVLGYDKDLSDAFNALRLQFGDQLSNLQPWATAATQDAAQTALGMSVSGKAVATGTPVQGRAGLQLGEAATRDVTASNLDNSANKLLKFGDFGVGYGLPSSEASVDNSLDDLVFPGFYSGVSSVAGKPIGLGAESTFPVIHAAVRSDSRYSAQIVFSRTKVAAWIRTKNTVWAGYAELYHTRNTTVDSNGFLKSASPVIKLFADAIDANDQAGAATLEKVATGHYQLTGTNGLRLDDGWYIETPHDKNGNKYFNIEWEQDHTPVTDAGVLDEPADVTLTIRCYERVWNPQTGRYDNGAPVDIPDGRWIDLRLNEVRQPEPEMPDEPGEPQQPTEPGAPAVPHMVTKAQGKAALIQAGLWQAVLDHVSGIEDETERMLAEIALHDAQDYHRNSPFLNATADALGLTEERKDELFILASNILL